MRTGISSMVRYPLGAKIVTEICGLKVKVNFESFRHCLRYSRVCDDFAINARRLDGLFRL